MLAFLTTAYNSVRGQETTNTQWYLVVPGVVLAQTGSKSNKCTAGARRCDKCPARSVYLPPSISPPSQSYQKPSAPGCNAMQCNSTNRSQGTKTRAPAIDLPPCTRMQGARFSDSPPSHTKKTPQKGKTSYNSSTKSTVGGLLCFGRPTTPIWVKPNHTQSGSNQAPFKIARARERDRQRDRIERAREEEKKLGQFFFLRVERNAAVEQKRLVHESADGRHGQAAVLDLLQLVLLAHGCGLGGEL